jgi:hypothetical protein
VNRHHARKPAPPHAVLLWEFAALFVWLAFFWLLLVAFR